MLSSDIVTSLKHELHARFHQFIDACLTKDYHKRLHTEQLLKHPFVADQPWARQVMQPSSNKSLYYY